MAQTGMLRTIVKENTELRETETLSDGTVNETRFFTMAPSRFNWLLEHGTMAAVQPADHTRHLISVSAFIENGRWNGWDWMQSEFDSAGMLVS